MRKADALVALVGLMAVAGSAAGQGLPTVVLSTYDAATNTLVVPDGVGARTMSLYNGLFRSPNGQRFICVANLTGETATNRVIVAGTVAGAASTGQVVIRKGAPIPGSTRTLNILDSPRINDAGQIAFSSNSLGTGDPVTFFFTGTAVPTATYSVAAAIGEPIPFLPGSTYSGGFQATLLDNTGRFGFTSSLDDGISTFKTVFFNGGIVARAADAATAPTPLPGSVGGDWTDFWLRRVYVDATGNNFCWLGTIGGTTDVVAVNNTVVAEEGAVLPVAGPTLGTFMSAWFEPGGDWYARGTLIDGATDFVLRNGAVVAQRGQPVTPASTVVWDRVSGTSTGNGFLYHVGNDRGDYIIAGNTLDTNDSTRSAAVVLNGDTVVLRRGDAIDTNGNGMDDDNTYIRGIKNEIGPGAAFLTNSGELWMVVDVENDAGTDLGDAIIRVLVTLPAACPADFNGVGGLTVQDIFDFLAAYFSNDPSADFNGVGGITVQDIFDFLAAYFAGCP